MSRRHRRHRAGRAARPFGLVVAAASLPMFMATLDNLVMTNALPVLHAELGATVEELQWFVNAYTLAFASSILMASALGDRFGRRTVFVDRHRDLQHRLGVRRAQHRPGAAHRRPRAAGLRRRRRVMPLSLTLLAGAVAPRRRPLAIGIWGGVAGLGVAAGPLVGGAIIEGWNWQAIFWINVPVGDHRHPARPPRAAQRLRRAARARRPRRVLAGGRRARPRLRHRPRQRRGLGLARGARRDRRRRVLLLAFVCWESRTKAPLLPLRLFRDRSFSIANVVGFAFSFGMFGSVFILIQFLQVVQGSTPLEAARADHAVDARADVRRPARRASSRRASAPACSSSSGLACRAARSSGSRATMSADLDYAALVAPFIAAGIGMGLVFAPSSTAVLATLARRPRQGLGHQLDAARDRRRPRHRRADRDLRRRRRRAHARPLRRRRPPRRLHGSGGAPRRGRRRALASRGPVQHGTDASASPRRRERPSCSRWAETPIREGGGRGIRSRQPPLSCPDRSDPPRGATTGRAGPLPERMSV